MFKNNCILLIHSSTILIYLTIITTAIEEKIEEKTTKNLITFNRIAGCPDLESFQHPFETLENSNKIGKITCLCGPSRELINEDNEEVDNDEKASITCIYGSKLEDLENTINLAKKANKSIEKVKK